MVTKKWISALALLATCAAACSAGGNDPNAAEPSTGKAEQAIAPLACTPLLATATPFLSCGSLTADNISLASSVQTQLITQMNAALANVSLTADWTANQVLLTSVAPEFTTLFGQQLVAPLATTGLFTATVPITLASFPAGFSLNANIFGFVPGALSLNTAFSTPLLPGFSSAAFNTSSTASFQATSSANLASSSLGVGAVPLSVFFTTPVVAGAPLTCSGALPLSCL